MLVVGFNSANNYHFSKKIDVDVDTDSPKSIHDLLKKEAGREMKGDGFTVIVCFDDDGDEVAAFEDGEDYDIADEEEEEVSDEDEEDPDSLFEEAEDDDDDD